MGVDVWRHLLAWELRYAARRPALWLMAAVAAVLPVAVGLGYAWVSERGGLASQGPWYQSLSLPAAAGTQTVVICLLISAWTVFSVKRQMAHDISDDWLLVMTWRQSLAARYLASAAIGLFVALVSVTTVTVAVALLAPEKLDLNWLLVVEPMVLCSLVQALAVAAILVGAKDFLMASPATVFSIGLCFGAAWCFVPCVGFYWPVALLAGLGQELQGPAWVFFPAAVFACGGLACFGWMRSEDFWDMVPDQSKRDGYDASIGEIRGALEGAGAGEVQRSRQAASRLRERLDQLHVPPWLAHDLSRYPVLSLPRDRAGWHRLTRLVAVATPVVVIYTGALACLRANAHQNLWFYWLWFAWWALAITVVVRALTSATQIVLQEREQGTMASLILAPLGLKRVLNAKLFVVFVQAFPWLVLLSFTPRFAAPVAELWLAVPCAILGGAWAGSRTGSRIGAVLWAMLSGAGLYLGVACLASWLAQGLSATVALATRAVVSAPVPPFRHVLDLERVVVQAGLATLCLLLLAGVWMLLRPRAVANLVQASNDRRG